MDNIRKAAKQMLEDKTVNMVLGFKEGSNGNVRAAFITDATQTDKLIFDDRCKQNLSLYLTKHEVKHHGKIAIVATVPVMRTIVMLLTEYQIKEENIKVIGISPEGQVLDLPDLGVMEKYLQSLQVDHPKKEKDLIEKLKIQSKAERFDFWKSELSRCIKCFACRSACPLCYCTRCATDCNQPQWISVPSHTLGNHEWHTLRAMHLTGRCTSCGECSRACPKDIPIAALTMFMSDVVEEHFGVKSGLSLKQQSVMSTYKPEDKESFIK